MMNWLMRMNPAPSVVDGLLQFQITGSPIPALIAIAVPIFRQVTLSSRMH